MEPTDEDLCRLHNQAGTVLESLRNAGLTPDDALFVLLLALAKFLAVLPAEARDGVLGDIHHALAGLAGLAADAEPDDTPARRYDA